MNISAYSSGGVGDAIIVLAKLYGIWLKKEGNQKIDWAHADKYPQYEKSIQEIMRSDFAKAFITVHSKYHLVDSKSRGFEWAMKEAVNHGGAYILTHANDPLFHPQNLPAIGNTKEFNSPTICIGVCGGRMEDSSKRIIMESSIRQIVGKFYDSYSVILLGLQDPGYQIPGATFMPTPSILDAFGFIDSCDGFVGQDGVLSYYSLLRNKSTLISYHMPELVNHYMNNTWVKKATILRGTSNLQIIPQPALEDFKKRVDNK